MGTVKDGRSSSAPLVGIPVDWAEFVVAMTKGDGLGRSVRSDWIKDKNDLPATLRPAAMHRGVVFADVLGGEHRSSVRSQVEGKDPSRRIGRWCVALVDPGKIGLVAPCHQGGKGGGNDPAERQQGAWDQTWEQGTDKHDE
jgi:hypothetical protein